jgi:hypothetical protein
MPCAADVEKCPDRQYWIERDVTDPALLPRLLQMPSKVGTLECPRVVTFPDMSVAFRVELEIELPFLLKKQPETTGYRASWPSPRWRCQVSSGARTHR